jgi:hypothetical protein
MIGTFRGNSFTGPLSPGQMQARTLIDVNQKSRSEVPHPRRPRASSEGHLGSPFVATGLSRSRKVTTAFRAVLRPEIDRGIKDQPLLVLRRSRSPPTRAVDAPSQT